jgi:hypothetical protein
MQNLKTKSRKLQLNRETVMPLLRDELGYVNGGKDDRDTRDRTQESVVFSAASGAAVGTVTSAAGAGVGGAIGGAASGVGASIDAASQRLGLPCWTVTTASIISRLTRR